MRDKEQENLGFMNTPILKLLVLFSSQTLKHMSSEKSPQKSDAYHAHYKIFPRSISLWFQQTSQSIDSSAHLNLIKLISNEPKLHKGQLE